MNTCIYTLNCNVLFLALFQSSLDRLEVALNSFCFPHILNTRTVLLCCFCPVLQAKSVRKDAKSGVSSSTRLKLLLDKVQPLPCDPNLLFFFKKLFSPVLLLILGSESLFSCLRDASLNSGGEERRYGESDAHANLSLLSSTIKLFNLLLDLVQLLE
jgi:hypothetical protein